MNLAEKYIEINKGLIILISGLSGSNRAALAKEISSNCPGRECYGSLGSSRTILAGEIERDFKLKMISLEDYCEKENVKVFEVNSELKIHDWEHIDVYNWDKFNKDVNNAKEKGVVVYGDYFPTFKLDFKPNFHIHVKLSKDNLIEKRKEYIDKNPEKCSELLEIIKNNQFDLIINKVTYPYYIEYRDKSNIDKYVNADKNTSDEIYDQVFDYIIFTMRKFLNEWQAEHPRAGVDHSEKQDDKPKKDHRPSKQEEEESESLSSTDLNGDSTSDIDLSDSDNESDEPIELGSIPNRVEEAYFLDA
jgi:uridine kinase